jgi:uncharacterized protein YndB with AHSA1/START domain
VSELDYVYETFIKAPPEKVWEGLTSPEFTRRYFWKTEVESTWELGAPVTFKNDEGRLFVEGEVIEASPPLRLCFTWRALWSEELAKEEASRVSFEIEQQGAVCHLRIVHDQFPAGSKTHEEVSGGWSAIVCSLKTLLETGEPLPVAGNE